MARPTGCRPRASARLGALSSPSRLPLGTLTPSGAPTSAAMTANEGRPSRGPSASLGEGGEAAAFGAPPRRRSPPPPPTPLRASRRTRAPPRARARVELGSRRVEERRAEIAELRSRDDPVSFVRNNTLCAYRSRGVPPRRAAPPPRRPSLARSREPPHGSPRSGGMHVPRHGVEGWRTAEASPLLGPEIFHHEAARVLAGGAPAKRAVVRTMLRHPVRDASTDAAISS